MEKVQRLREANTEPTNEVIAESLGKAFSAYTKFIDGTKSRGITIEWRYYNDSKAWLGKAQEKKKTVFWLSVWEGFFMASFFFTEKTKGGIQDLNISNEIKEKLANAPAVGKLIPLIFEVEEEKQLQDLFPVVEYKKHLK